MPTAVRSDRPIRIVLVQPEGYAHAGALSELVETLLYGLNALGIPVDFALNECAAGATNLVVGAHLLDTDGLAALPSDAILYNSEQIDESSSWMQPAYLAALQRHSVWDYGAENVRRLRARGAGQVRHVPLGYVPQLTRIPVLPPEEQDIDVLFYGAINPRRQAVLEGLIARGLRIEFLSGVYREERDRYVARAKLILNLHYYPASVFETVRVSYLLANEKAVVAECGPHTTLPPELADALCAVPYEGLIDACCQLVADAGARANLARRGFETFTRLDAATHLAAALEYPTPPAGPMLPAYLNLGSGKDWRANCLNVDLDTTFRPDAVLDIARPDALGAPLESARFGAFSLHDNQFEAIFANDVLEHIPDLKTAMENCLRLIKPGGSFHIQVPYELSLGAWQDPTHVRAFNENSWLYYTDWYWYLGWSEARFDRLGTEFELSALGHELHAAGTSLAEILRTPRAVDAMRVVLRKRYLQESEIERAANALQRPWDAAEGPQP